MAASVGVKKQGEGLQNQIQTPKEGAAPMGGGGMRRPLLATLGASQKAESTAENKAPLLGEE